MFSKLRKASEAIGHIGNVWTFAGLIGWQAGLTAIGVGMLTWAATFFGAAGEGLSVTAVWVASLAAGLLVAVIGLVIALIITVLRIQKASPETTAAASVRKWLNIADALIAFADQQLVATRDGLEEKLVDAFDKGFAAEAKLSSLTKRGAAEPAPGTADARAAEHARLLIKHYSDRRDRLEIEIRQAWTAMRSDLIKKLNDGMLVAKGFRSPHVVGSKEITIPQDEWRILALDNVASEAFIRDGQVAYTGVLIGKPEGL
jgi:hypothetical protein